MNIPFRTILTFITLSAVTFIVTLLSSVNSAKADLRLCNETEARVSVAIGYKTDEGWRSEGWWNFSPREDQNACKVLLRGPLRARYFYVYALDITNGGEWSGEARLCTRQKEFTIDGIKDCIPRGFEQTGFFEVDTKNQPSWTVTLTDIDNGRN